MESHIKRPGQQSPGIRFDHLAGGGRIDINRRTFGTFRGAATQHIFAPGPSVDPRIAHARSETGVVLGDNKGLGGPLVLEQGRDSPAFVLTVRSPAERTTSAKRPRWFNE